ncbi:hypothetical protein AJ80_02103 [Polytolypa hystricis UAMH7299]|uniref:Non-reducing polyketide synthase nscA n=1 Tax=Polytolypa hystricis (strain UAMH7299) TaxID=1447883 RepID=A0A2B7YRB1_POLH7|nr:hypothetical protein AJ80_02103 [Polytolypa hystricis UAMH7299]
MSPEPTYNEGATPSIRPAIGGLDPIAVIGFSLRFPEDAVSPESFWDMLMAKRCASKEIPRDRMNIDSFYHPDTGRVDTLSLRSGHFIKGDLAEFDAPFFSITPAEAAGLDPQQRILLETAYGALENAGIPMEKIFGSKTCVFNGSFANDYAPILLKDPLFPAKYTSLGTAASILANRISWFFGLNGPSINVDSACSSSMMALDLACQSLWNGDSEMGLVSGSNLNMIPETNQSMSNLGFLSPDGRCYSFDHRGNGYARGEGFGVVIIKRLSDAIRDGDTIRAVIRSTGSNSDGRTPGMSLPSKEAQEVLIRDTYKKAGLDLEATRFVEAHGTGTAVGDPIESAAIGAAFRKMRSPEDPLYIGAVKSNIGHLEGASGIAGLIKTIMVLEKGVIPPNTNFELLNPKIDAEYLNICFPQEPIPWPENGLRRASVSSFGFGGSNSHVIIEDAYNHLLVNGLRGNHSTSEKPPVITDVEKNKLVALPCWHVIMNFMGQKRKPRLLVWSAADGDGLSRLEAIYSNRFAHVSPGPDTTKYLDNLSYTLAARRSLLSWRAFAIVDDIQSLNAPGFMSKPIRSSESPRLGFVFSGQGAQWFAMGRELFDYPVFKNSLEEANLYLHGLGCRWSVLDELLKTKEESRIDEAELSQTLCTAIQVALVDLVATFGVAPAAVVGHSSGEIAAAYAAKFISRSSAWKLAYYRGVTMSTLIDKAQMDDSETMMSVGLPEDEIQQHFEVVSKEFGHLGLVVACVNSPHNVTVSGKEVQIDFLKSMMEEQRVFAQKLRVKIAYHSPQMLQIADQYLKAIQNLEMGKNGSAGPAMISSVTGQRVYADDVIQSEYWVKNLVSQVKFSNALASICTQPAKASRKKLDGRHRKTVQVHQLVEIGPHSALRAPIRDILQTADRQQAIGYTSLLKRNESAETTILEALGHLHCTGYPVDLAVVNEFGCDSDTFERPKVLTDLPEYPFNHTNRYWHESRVSKEYRLREVGRHDLLGTPVNDWNPLEARWRNVIKASELPWIMDHKVNGTILYPAAGMLVMAIEAANQLADPDRKVLGYNIRDTRFRAALKIPVTSDSFESQFHLRPQGESHPFGTGWFEFKLYTYEDIEWVENCYGFIQIEYEKADVPDIENSKERNELLAHHASAFELGRENCFRPVATDTMYSRMFNCGFEYGPTFRAVDNLVCGDDGQAIADIHVYQWQNDQRAPHAQPHIIHPITLDAMVQMTFNALTPDDTNELPTMVPTRVQKLWISHSGLSYPASEKVSAYTTAKWVGSRNIQSTTVIVDEHSELRTLIDGLEMTAVTATNAENQLQTSVPQLCFDMDWKPDVHLLDRKQLFDYCEGARPTEAEPVSYLKDLEILLVSYITQTLDTLTDQETANLTPHLQKYVEWMKHEADLLSAGTLHGGLEWREFLQDSKYLSAVANKVEETSIVGKFFVTVGRNLLAILRGEIDALELLFRDELVAEYYYDLWDRLPCTQTFANFLDAYAHKSPAMKFLEVGAGTGAMSNHVLDTLAMYDDGKLKSQRFTQYDYTDISPAFFEKAQERYADYDKVGFKVFDIEKDPETQGLEPGSYDVIIAGSVLHTASNISLALKNIRKLLKPDGKFVFYELTHLDNLRSGFVFGLLPGWWSSSEDYRRWGPCINEEKWNEVLIENGFTGIDISLPDYLDEFCRQSSVMVTTAKAELKADPNGFEVIMVGDTYSEIQNGVASRLRDELGPMATLDQSIITVQEAAATPSTDAVYIFISEIDKPLLLTIDDPTYSSLHVLLTTARTIFWVTGNPTEHPEYGIIHGLARTIANENNSVKFTTVAIEDPTTSPEQHASHIVGVLKQALATSVDDCEPEYVERAGKLEISRLIESCDLNEDIHSRLIPQQMKTQPFGDCASLKLNVGAPGLLDEPKFVEDAEHGEPLGQGQVEIKVEAIGLGFDDYLVATGRGNRDTIGNECAGSVTRVGEGVSLIPGDRVAACALNTVKTYVRTSWQQVVKIPDTLSYTEAAIFPADFTIAWHSLVEIARIRNSDTVLIHSGAGGAGQAAIQIAQHHGAEVFVTVGSAEERTIVTDKYSIPVDHVFSNKSNVFAENVKRVTKGVGVDVVLNSLSGDLRIASWECVAPFGRIIDIGRQDTLPRGQLQAVPFAQNITFSTVDLLSMVTDRPSMIQNSLRAVMDLVAEAKFCPAEPLQTCRLPELGPTLKSMQNGSSSGRLVLEIKEDDPVLTFLDTKQTYNFRKDVSYVISGGLGGIGRVIARWMVEKGARNLILLSRSGAKSEAAKSLVADLEKIGAVVATPKCDITEEIEVQAALAECAKVMPEIKGSITCSMVLQDSTFENMTFETWSAAVRPKAQGSWNLHRSLPQDLDFFVMLSSIAGIIGAGAQGNYAAGNTYQDALLRHRLSRGQKAASIDLGVMLDVGILTENKELLERPHTYNIFKPVTEEELLALMDKFCDPSCDLLTPVRGQPVVGIDVPNGFRDQGVGGDYWRNKPLFRQLFMMSTAGTSSAIEGSEIVDYVTQFVNAKTLKEAGAVVSDALQKKLSKSLSVPVEEIDPSKQMNSYGVDSLVAVDLRNWFLREWNTDIAIFDILGGATVSTIGLVVAGKSPHRLTTQV